LLLRRAISVAVCAGMLLAAAQPSISEMTLPIDGLKMKDIRDMFAETHNGHAHEAIDLMAPKGTPVHAVTSGTVRKLFLSKAGGITIYQFDDEQVYCYYYAHLDQYSEGLHEGMHVEKGEVIGFVGTTGNAVATSPHLHFAIFELGSEKRWWKGTPVNPYAGLVAALERGY